MKLAITHSTTYRYDEPVYYALQQVRLTPKTREGQEVLDWNISVSGGQIELQFDDHHNNKVCLVSVDQGADHIDVEVSGSVLTSNNSGMVGQHGGFAPLWLFKRSTELTKPGPLVRAMLKKLDAGISDDIEKLHALSAMVADDITYETGQTGVDTTSEDALALGKGVCQDHSHVFLTACRLLGFPARYVSGYLMLNDSVSQDASHAWTEVHVEGLGWVGFDISNRISPDERYVPVATGLDYSETSPISGMRLGDGAESMIVNIQVQQ